MRFLKNVPWPITILTIGAFAIRMHGIRWGLPEVYEEAYPFKAAWDMWAWGPYHAFQWDPHFFKYPSLTIYVQLAGQGLLYLAFWIMGVIQSTLVFRVLYEVDKTPFYLVCL